MQNNSDYSEILDYGKIGIFDWDLQNNLILLSALACEQLGYKVTDSEMMEFKPSELISESELSEILSYIESLTVEQSPDFCYQHTLKQEDGFSCWVQNRGKLIYDSKRPIRIISSITDITELKVSELNFKESEERYRCLFESSNDGLIYLDKDCNSIIYVNNILSEISGYPVEELMEMKLSELIYKEISKQIKDLRFLSDSILSDVPLRTKTNEYVYVDISCITTEVDNAEYYICLVRDVTQRRIFEFSVLHSKIKYHAYFSNAPSGIFIVDNHGNYHEVNPAGVKLLGYSESELLTMNIRDVLEPSNLEKSLQNFQGLIQNEFNSYTETCITKQGDSVILSINAVKINENRFIAFAQDITEKREIELALKTSEDQLKSIINDSPIGISVYGTDGQCIISNPSLAKIIGATQEEVLRQNYNTILTWKESGLYSKVLEALETNRTMKHEISTISSFGKECCFEYYIVPMSDKKIILMVNDISERNRNELIQKALLDISESVNKTRNLNELLKQVDIILGTLIDTKNLYIALYDKEIDLYSFPYNKNQDSKVDIKTQSLKKSFTDYVRRTGKPIIVNQNSINAFLKSGEVEIVGKPSKVWLGTPLKTSSGVIGVLSVQSYDNPDEYSYKDLEVLSFASEQIALAIERKRSEEALLESEKMFKMIADQSFDAIVMLNLKGVMNYVSPAMVKLSGYDELELLGTSVFKITPDSEHPKIIESFEAHARGEFAHLATKLIKKNGEIAEIEVNAAPIMKDGVVIGGCGFLDDVTELNSTLRKLQESEEKFKRITERSFDAIYVVNRDLVLEYISPSMERNFGHKSEDVLGRSSLDYIPEEDIESTRIALQKVLQGEKLENDTARIVCTDGRICDLEVNVVPVYKGDEIVGAQGMIRDVTEKEAALKSLQLAEKEYRNLFEFAPISTWREDFSDVKCYIETLREKGVKDFREYFEQHSDEVYKCFSMIKVVDINQEVVNLHNAKDKEEVLNSIDKVFEGVSMEVLIEELMFLIEGGSKLVIEAETNTFDGERKNILVNVTLDTTVDDWSNAYVSIIDITELKETEKALRKAESEYRNLFEFAPIATARQDFSEIKKFFAELKACGNDDLRTYFEEHPEEVRKCFSLIQVVDVNDEVLKLHNVTTMQDYQKSFARVFNDVPIEILKKQLFFLIDGGTKYVTESILKTFDGRTKNILVNLTLDKTYDDWSAAYVSIIDITNLKDTEKALRESEKRYKYLFEVAQEGIWIFDAESCTTLVNQSLASMFGYKAEEMIGKHIFEFMDTDEKEKSKDYLNELQNLSRKIYKFEFINKSGTKLYTTFETAPIYDAEENYIGYIASVVDVSDIKSVKTELHETKLEFDQILAKSHAVVYIKDLNHKYLFVNSRFEDIFELSSSQIIGKTDHELFDKKYADFFVDNDVKVINGKYDIRVHEVVLEKDNIEHTYISDKFPLFDSAGRMYATCGISTDITELLEIQDKERKLHQQLVLKDRLINAGHLAAAVAHEINNPMTVLHGSLEEMKESSDSIDPDVIDGMLVVSRRIREIINSLLVFTRQTEHTKEKVDINSIIQSKFLLVGNILKKSKIEYSLELSDHSPMLHIDRAQIEQVFLNIILNAIDAMKNGGIFVIKSFQKDDYFHITFEDNGEGISQEHIDSIFLPFFTTKDVGEGTGLGLSISHGIVEEHGGKILVSSKVGEGSIFTVTLPLT